MYQLLLYIHTYIYTYIPTYIHTYLHIYIRTLAFDRFLTLCIDFNRTPSTILQMVMGHLFDIHYIITIVLKEYKLIGGRGEILI